MDWKPPNGLIRYDRARVERTDPIAREIDKLGLPLIRQRKLNGILNALIMQIEDGGDSPEVNLSRPRMLIRQEIPAHSAPV